MELERIHAMYIASLNTTDHIGVVCVCFLNYSVIFRLTFQIYFRIIFFIHLKKKLSRIYSLRI